MERAGYEHKTALGGGFKYYLNKGFVPYPIPEGKFGGHQDGASLTMEYAYQDWTLAQFAKNWGIRRTMMCLPCVPKIIKMFSTKFPVG